MRKLERENMDYDSSGGNMLDFYILQPFPIYSLSDPQYEPELVYEDFYWISREYARRIWGS